MSKITSIQIDESNLKIGYIPDPNENTFSLATNGIFMDTFGRWAFNQKDSNAYPSLTMNGRSIVNYMYMAKTLSENSSQIQGKKIPISFF